MKVSPYSQRQNQTNFKGKYSGALSTEFKNHANKFLANMPYDVIGYRADDKLVMSAMGPVGNVRTEKPLSETKSLAEQISMLEQNFFDVKRAVVERLDDLVPKNAKRH